MSFATRKVILQQTRIQASSRINSSLIASYAAIQRNEPSFTYTPLAAWKGKVKPFTVSVSDVQDIMDSIVHRPFLLGFINMFARCEAYMCPYQEYSPSSIIQQGLTKELTAAKERVEDEGTLWFYSLLGDRPDEKDWTKKDFNTLTQEYGDSDLKRIWHTGITRFIFSLEHLGVPEDPGYYLG